MPLKSPIQYRLIVHRNESRILVQFPNIQKLNEQIRKVKDARWSSTYQAWHIPDTTANREKCGILPSSVNTLNSCTNINTKVTIADISSNKYNRYTRLSLDNKKAFIDFTHKLQLKKYSASTIKTYQYEFLQLLHKLNTISAASLETEHIKRYLLWCVNEGYKENTLHSRINALKFYYEQVLRKEKIFFEIPRPKKPILLPKVLGETEVGRLFKAVTNLKHKAILFTAYSAGLRVSEVVKLKLTDIDSSRMQIRVEQAKGKKDRYVNLSVLLLDILRAYLKSCKLKPTTFLFEGELPGYPYSTRSAQLLFHYAKEKAGIKKEVSFHSLRHSFATHMLEKGIDIRYIKDLLGHFSIKTTERYLHVKKETLINIVSPLDDLWKRGLLD